MKDLKKIGRTLFILALASALQACVPGKLLMTSAADPAEVRGTYTLMLYGCHYPDQISNVAILVAGNSRYPVEIYDLDTSYKVRKDVPSRQALAEADSFVRCSTHRIWQTELRRIPDGRGGTIGYEIRPLYFPLEFGQADVMIDSYVLKDGKVTAYLKLDPSVERALEPAGDRNENPSNQR